MTGPGRDAVRLQPLVRARIGALGAAGQAWADALPEVVGALAERWSLRIGRPLPGGSASYLVTAVRADGSAAVLKVAVPEIDGEARTSFLAGADGRGYVRVLASAPEHHALLLERLGPSLDQSGLAVQDQLDALARTLLAAWRPPESPARPKAEQLASGIEQWRDHARGFEGAVDRALAYAAVLARSDPAHLMVVHGDPHPGNLLRVLEARPGADTGWCFVDPDPLVADRAYDLGVAVRDFSATLLAEPTSAPDPLWSWCERVAEPSGTDPERVWAWGFLERVSTGLYVTSFGAPRVGEPFLRSAELLTRAKPARRSRTARPQPA